jgi:hypothetical protein
VAETCTGESADCPADTFQPSSVVCRAAAGPCDVPEYCSGSSAECPNDQFANAGAFCRAGGECTFDALCSGSSSTCPPNPNRPNDSQCTGGYGYCENGACICKDFGSTCGNDYECCSDVCDIFGLCDCGFPLDGCSEDRNCCGDLTCNNCGLYNCCS